METYQGHVRTPGDAIILFEACRLGLLPRVQRRLSEKERQSIKSGSVFVWDEREAGMRRWTDGKSWSASRVSGSFLTYREMEGKRGGGNSFAPPVAAVQRAGKTPDSTRGSDSDVDMPDEGPDGYRYKPDGLMKQSFSITTAGGAHLHLISYYSRSHPTSQALNSPSTDPALRMIRPQKGMYPESTVHDPQNVPAVTRGPMQGPSFAPPQHGVPPPPGYPRPGATHPGSYAPPPPGYGWPPSPVSTPPAPYGMGGPGPPNQQPNGSGAGMSPLQYSQNASPSQVHPSGSSYENPPPHMLEGNRAGPSHPPPPHRNSGSPHFIPNPSPRMAQTPQALPQPPDQAQASKIDPRLTAMSAPSPRMNNPNPPMRTPPSSSRNLEGSPTLRELGTSGSNSIPSIGSLMNGAGAGGSPSAQGAEGGDSKSDSGEGRESRSPGGTRKSTGPKDIPSEKLGFGEDVRALRVLDGRFLHR
ncbi:MAG: hypothetical protein M4579_007325 [Chaenotheca gracillima]|nr:MAG: hypothetical protein M4579_007325 [Chaenotheca gracillima]